MSKTDISPQVDLRFERRGEGMTFLARQHAGYPFHVGRVLRRADAPPTAATVLLQCCSGGLFEHDQVAVHVKVCTGAGARVGNAAATVVHSMTSGQAVLKVRLEAQAGAWLEYMPALTILFPRARLVSGIDVVLHPGSLVILSDSFLAHDPGAQTEPFDALDTCLTVRNELGEILVCDRITLDGALWGRAAAGVSAAFTAHGSFMVLTYGSNTGELACLLQAVIGGQPGAYVGIGMLPNQCGVLVRALADSGESLRQVLLQATLAMREAFTLGSATQQSTAKVPA